MKLDPSPPAVEGCGQYILDDLGQPVPEPDVIKWATWFKSANRIVALDVIDGRFKVSTVFLGIDHGFGSSPLPVLWETMIFGPDGHDLDMWQMRDSTRAAAEESHREALRLVRAAVEGGR